MKTKLALCAPVSEMVSAVELAAIKRDREKLAKMRAEWEEAADELHDREENVITRIEAGARVDGAAEVVTRRKQNISWLTIVKRELGEKVVLKIKDRWPVTFYKVLQLP